MAGAASSGGGNAFGQKGTATVSERRAAYYNFGLALRNLGKKCVARIVLAAMGPYIPSDLYGSVPNKGTMDAAFKLQSILEEAQSKASSAVGISLDLSEAYNTLPRQMMELLAAKAGWPESLIRTYRSFLDRLRRSFKLHGGYHLPKSSTIGVPEGCPIAVPVMILFAWSITLLAQSNGGRMISVVYNWTLLAQSMPETELLLKQTKLSADDLGLILNPDKNCAFATKASDRAALRKVCFDGYNLDVCHTRADLEVFFTTIQRASSQCLQKRFHSNVGKFARLQALPWSSTRIQLLCQEGHGR